MKDYCSSGMMHSAGEQTVLLTSARAELCELPMSGLKAAADSFPVMGAARSGRVVNSATGPVKVLPLTTAQIL